MNSLKINAALRSFANKNHFGRGTFDLKNGANVNILSNPKTELFHIIQIENDQIVRASGGRGYIAMSKVIDDYKSKAQSLNDIFKAFEQSFKTKI